MKDGRTYLIFWLVNSLFFYFSPLLFTGLVVTGNSRLTPFMASLVSGFLLTVLNALTQPAFKSLKVSLKDEWQWGMVFLFVNVLGIWVIARYADLTGVGVLNAWIAVLLGFILNLIQWAVWKFMSQKNK